MKEKLSSVKIIKERIKEPVSYVGEDVEAGHSIALV